MPRIERGGVKIESVHDLKDIAHHHEREFGRYLGTQNVKADYETVEFQVSGINPRTGEYGLMSHRPDFPVIDLESGKECFIEITTSPYDPESFDPKARQKKIMELYMEEIGENIVYLVLYQQNLMEIQNSYPELRLNFFQRADGLYSPK